MRELDEMGNQTMRVGLYHRVLWINSFLIHEDKFTWMKVFENKQTIDDFFNPILGDIILKKQLHPSVYTRLKELTD